MGESFTITRIAHSCRPIQIGDTAVPTDPWFSQLFLQPEALPAGAADRESSSSARG